MKKTNNIIKMEKKENKKTNLVSVLAGIIFFIIIVLLFAIIVSLIQVDGNKTGEEINNLNGNKNGENDQFSAYFAGCDLLNKECLSMDCEQYFLCNDEEYSVCEVYDCGEEFGIGTKDKDGKIKIERELKDNRKKITEVKSRCGGSLEVTESNYANEKFEGKVKVATAGSCEIGGFLVSCKNLETGKSKNFKPAKFSDLGDSLYSISVNNCSEISKIIAIGENGVSIK